jgi:hypothetical protein
MSETLICCPYIPKTTELPFFMPGLWLRKGQGQKVSLPITKEKPAFKDQKDKAVICRKCFYQITTADKQISVDGARTHTFFNPAGIVYEIICFSTAPGCIFDGAVSNEFSWFAGFTWRLAFCGKCLTHLGWLFESCDSSFLGLILKRLGGDI